MGTGSDGRDQNVNGYKALLAMNNTNQISVQVFSSDHQEGVIDLIVGIQQREFGIAITAEDQPDLHTIPAYYQKRTGNFWVAVVENKVIGTIALLDIGNGQAALRKMFVHKHYRGAAFKVATRLLETLLGWGRSAGVTAIYLGTTPKFVAAHRFYEKNGFDEIPKSALPTAFPIMRVDTKFYKYRM